MIVIVDYGIGNLFSVQNMLNYLGINAKISSSSDDIRNANKLILPGVGHFKVGMENLRKANLVEILSEEVLVKRKTILGICLGMQLMTRHSDEGDCPGLGWIDAKTKKFKFEGSLKVPHMGWNDVVYKYPSLLNEDMLLESRYYFVHSYHVSCTYPSDVLATTMYGYEFPSAFSRENIFGVQFHPEKSHKFGMRLFQNFNKL